ncbi:MAG: non-homologous end-joining DNA ligase [Parvibaculum sp.]|uniref:non-homologous end-joining DNA ligase n=1 Tax=Parvibaculum sp. TaxID=2024848 RepID=UPI0032641237
MARRKTNARMKRNPDLDAYRAKRDFDHTPEPEPADGKPRRRKHDYAIQMHDARNLHYDLRLELDGTLKSWAVAKGPSLDPAKKRLAIKTEDHPVDYADFEGTIPEGHYGAGTVLLWDRGTWEPVGDPHDGLENGKLIFDLHGERLKGRWALVRFKPKGRQKKENWLLIKERDEKARRSKQPVKEYDTSVASGLDTGEIARRHETGRKTKGMKAELRINSIHITHPDRVLFPEQGVTKLDLARYLETASGQMMPYVENRLVSLVRCPEGRQKKCFFQRHAGAGLNDGFRTLEVRGAKESEDYLCLDGKKGLVAAAQMGVLEFHIWGSRIDDIERPDRLVFDLDPGPGLPFDAVIEAAYETQTVLAALGLKSFPLLTGGKGIHVVAPLTRRHEWPVVKAFAKAIAEHMANARPSRYLAISSKKKREGKIFIDYLRNDHSATAIAPYSPRARKGAPVAWPVSWKELQTVESANEVTISSAFSHRKKNPWKEYGSVRQSLKSAALRKLGIET